MISIYEKCMFCNGSRCPKCGGRGYSEKPHELIISKRAIFVHAAYLSWAYCTFVLVVLALSSCVGMHPRSLANGMGYLADKWSAKPTYTQPEPIHTEPIMNQIYKQYQPPRCEVIQIMNPQTYMYEFHEVCQ